MRRGGFGAYQRVFGRPIRLPEGIHLDELPSMEVVSRACGPDEELRRSIEMRKLAVEKFQEADSADRWRRALHRRTRPDRNHFEIGDKVFFWRHFMDRTSEECWHGPARVLQVEKPGSVWITYQGGLLKCSPEQLRPAAPEEEAAEQHVKQDMREQTPPNPGGRRKYVDITAEGMPPEDLPPLGVTSDADAGEEDAAEVVPEGHRVAPREIDEPGSEKIQV